ncbi:ORF6N domain-containing protein [Duganella radicis]|uniref:ORF6N domain-containing protein n=1 Tax=Duganella radicis TaxID=551988 RepID=A0A6L6PMC4_9BURK|nr:ORF6N domain-containing protein [Duganella radicis]MTV39777.1 ORF6N domain-containing protein [Duganella radicis]
MSATPDTSLVAIEGRILLIRSQKVIIDADLAFLYGVPTRRLNEQVKRNPDRFPPDFMFTLTAAEKAEVVANCDILGKLKFSKTLPTAFTEHGAIQAANVLGSPQAIQMGVYVVHSFVRLREMLVADKALASRLGELERQLSAMALRQDDFEGKTAQEFQQVFEALRSLMAPPTAGRKRPIGFVQQTDK